MFGLAVKGEHRFHRAGEQDGPCAAKQKVQHLAPAAPLSQMGLGYSAIWEMFAFNW